MKDRNAPPYLVVLLGVLVILFAGYMGAFYSLVTDGEFTVLLDGNGGDTIFPSYRVEHPAVSAIFQPAVQLDRMLRPNRWKY